MVEKWLQKPALYFWDFCNSKRRTRLETLYVFLMIRSQPESTLPSTNSYSSELCQVCGANLDSPLLLNYGGQSCLSCRAFFRRVHQRSLEYPNFQCRRQNDCEMTPRSRRHCRKCRYEMCLKAGMKPEAVLTDDQIKNRFRYHSVETSGIFCHSDFTWNQFLQI